MNCEVDASLVPTAELTLAKFPTKRMMPAKFSPVSFLGHRTRVLDAYLLQIRS